MNDSSSFLGTFVVTAWWHDESLVARIRAYRRPDGPVEDLGAAAGAEAIVAKLSDWLQKAPLERSQWPQ